MCLHLNIITGSMSIVSREVRRSFQRNAVQLIIMPVSYLYNDRFRSKSKYYCPNIWQNGYFLSINGIRPVPGVCLVQVYCLSASVLLAFVFALCTVLSQSY